jgi:hypothetical protein
MAIMLEILTSGASLGVHVPGLILRHRLREHGIDSNIRVLETLLPEHKQASVVKSKWAFHRDFRLALAGQRVAASPVPVMDEAAVRILLHWWRQRSVSRFIVFSGYWLPLLRDFASGVPWPLQVDLCRLDAAPMSSFQHGGLAPAESREICLADTEQLTLPWTIPVTTRPPVSWQDRNGRVLAHGGGWGIGTYRTRIKELPDSFGVDVLAYESMDVDHNNSDFRFFMIDPEWHPWLDNDYPPLSQVLPQPDFLWIGISFEKWRATEFATAVLEELHENLVPAARATPDYVSALVDELSLDPPVN